MLLATRRPTRRLVLVLFAAALFLSIVYSMATAGRVTQTTRIVPADSQLAVQNNVTEEEENDIGPGIDSHGRPVPHYRTLYSLTSPERKFWLVWWDGEAAYNPNLIPHPTDSERWIVMAQHERSDEGQQLHIGEELTCVAGFLLDKLVCQDPPTVVPIGPSIVGNCTGDHAWMNFGGGPRDGRMFYGPGNPWIMYGSQSKHACLGLWAQDARTLLEPFQAEQKDAVLFTEATELQRPPPWGTFQKNFFMFWDGQGVTYVHHDIWPKRTFARLGPVGDVGEDLAPAAEATDSQCFRQLMPKVSDWDGHQVFQLPPNSLHSPELIHQATNSLSITLCKRSDQTCLPSDGNTFIMHIFHWRSLYEFHPVYNPYIVLFDRTAPFALHGIGQRPFWVNGRSNITAASGNPKYATCPECIPQGHSEMFYFTSMSWKDRGQKYHGYIDDTIFLAFGVEDNKSGVIDVTAGDLLQDLALCGATM